MARDRRGEGGESLLELIIAVSILGLGVVTLLGSLTTTVLTSRVHRSQADVSAVLTAASERVKSAPYRACADSGDYLDNPTAFSYPGYAGPAPQFTIADWNGVAFIPRPVSTTTPRPCDQFEDLGYREQLVTLTVVNTSSGVSQTLPIVKRYRDCPTPAATLPGCG